ncbi:MAG: endonuclease domain-containing protein [Sphingomicrobium sp.]
MKATADSMRTARSQRRAMSLPEVLLWQLLRRSPNGIRFRRQHPIGPYVADFYCPAVHLVIEIDGAAHAMGDRPTRDAVRDAWLRNEGLEVVRIPAAELLSDPVVVADAWRICLLQTRGLSRDKAEPHKSQQQGEGGTNDY